VWLWGQREGLGITQNVFEFFYDLFPEDDPFWDVVIGDPGIRSCSTARCTCVAP
jgi:hypothetical protein